MEKDSLEISLFFPVYNDERTVRRVTEKALDVLARIASRYEVLIIDDGSPDRSGEIADELAEEHEHVRVIHHGKNLGYGEAVQTGFKESRFEWICFTDGDDEYDVYDLLKLIRLKDFYDLIITFRYVRLYSGVRTLISKVYNAVVRFVFHANYRDISTGLRLARKSVVDLVDLHSSSPFIGAELTIKVMLMGFRVGEVGIQTFPREFGRGATISIPNILATIRDLMETRKLIFSKYYGLPHGRERRRESR